MPGRGEEAPRSRRLDISGQVTLRRLTRPAPTGRLVSTSLSQSSIFFFHQNHREQLTSLLSQQCKSQLYSPLRDGKIVTPGERYLRRPDLFGTHRLGTRGRIALLDGRISSARASRWRATGSASRRARLATPSYFKPCASATVTSASVSGACRGVLRACIALLAAPAGWSPRCRLAAQNRSNERSTLSIQDPAGFGQ